MRETRGKTVLREEQKKTKNKGVASVKVLQAVERRPISSASAHIQKHPPAKQVTLFHFLSPSFASFHPRYRTPRFQTCNVTRISYLIKLLRDTSHTSNSRKLNPPRLRQAARRARPLVLKYLRPGTKILQKT